MSDDELSRLRAENAELRAALEGLRTASRAEHEQRELALQVAGVGLFAFDFAANAGVMDETTRRLLGVSPDSPAPSLSGLVERVHPDDRARFQTAVDRLSEGGTIEIEHRVVRADGSAGWVRAVGKIVSGTSRLVGVVLDLTAHRALQARLIQAQRLDSIGLLAGGIAHDFNNLLTIILGATTRAMALAPSGTSLQELLLEAIEAAKRSVGLTSQLLAFARQREIEPRIVSVGELVSRMERLLRSALGSTVTLECTTEETWPVRADPHQLEQAILNLVVNARDAMPRGGRLRITASNEAIEPGGEVPAGRYVLLRVDDEGEGIAADVLPHVFEPFFTTKEHAGGTGLGLATVYGIVRQHEGHVRVESELGRGTRFEVRLPAMASAPAPRATGPRTILVVEDEPHVRAVVVMTLKRFGYEVLEACDSTQALALVGSHPEPIDLLLSDVMLPRVTGPEIAARARALRPQMRVLFMSGYSEHSFDAGTQLLPKPFTPSVLAAKVRSVLEGG
ncbi:MAG: response regulator [Sandaracinaceae bacterium]|nr:response regulator [Sandaracinaceae bacterium]